jgi:hypothetical protein
MMQKAVADRIHILVGDVIPSNAVVSQVSALLADHSQCYDTSGKPRSDLFVVDANPNISVFHLFKTYSLLQVSDLYPKELEQGCCMNTRDPHEYDTFNPDQIISVPSDRNTDGSIDIIMSTGEGKDIRRTQADDRNAWDDTSHSMETGQIFPWEELPR